MTDNSDFDSHVDDLGFVDAEPLTHSGATCDAFRVRRYGKWHFLKRLKPEYTYDPRYVASMEKEFETAYRLDHPALPRYIERGRDYILMEWIDGQTLTEYMDENPKAFADKKRLQAFCQQLLQVLQYLHAHQILHLDLKPDNILITRIGQELRLVDFGFCYTDCNPFTTGHTDFFAAPEQLSATAGLNSFTAATDLYAFGRILLFISSAVSLPPVYRQVMQRCVNPQPEDRFQSAQEVMDALTAKNPRSKAVLVVSFSALLIALGIFWLFSGLRQNDAPSTDIHPAQPTTSDSLAFSPNPVKQDTTSLSVPRDLQEPRSTSVPPSPQYPQESSRQSPTSPQTSPLEQQSSITITYLEKEIKKPISPTKGKFPEFDNAVIAACESVFQSTVETFRDSVYSESPSVMRNWTLAMKNCRNQLPPIQQDLQLQFKGQVPSHEVAYYLNDYVDAKINNIMAHMLLNAYRQRH